MHILLTGGCGFIGSHTALALFEAGHEPVLLDNFDNSQRSVADTRPGASSGTRAALPASGARAASSAVSIDMKA